MYKVLISITIFLSCQLCLAVEFKNIIVIGWDGADYRHVSKLLKRNQLPNLKTITKQGYFSKLNTTIDATVTKPGWSQLFTGYSSTITNVKDNQEYAPIPLGLTIFERLKKKFKKQNIKIVFIGSKKDNLGVKGPHHICVNCQSRFKLSRLKTNYKTINTKAPLKSGETERKLEFRKGDPFYNALSSLDYYYSKIQQSSFTYAMYRKEYEAVKNKRFFIFLHFSDPDEQMHLFGVKSKEYFISMRKNDRLLGKIIAQLKEDNLHQKTLLFILSDHGANNRGFGHHKAPLGFLASNIKSMHLNGDRLDFTPTLLDLYGFDIKAIKPPFPGKSLLKKGYRTK